MFKILLTLSKPSFHDTKSTLNYLAVNQFSFSSLKQKSNECLAKHKESDFEYSVIVDAGQGGLSISETAEMLFQ